MEVRAFKLPPLPGKKHLHIPARASRVFEQDPPGSVNCIPAPLRSIEKQNKQNVRTNSLKRPASVRSFSRQSVNSRQSKDSRNSSRERVEQTKEKINHNVKTRMSMPFVSAKSWAVYEMKQQKLIYGKRVFKRKEIASLTKIMNLITIIELVKQFQLDAARIMIRVSRESSLLNGTSAQLKQNYELSLHDLYFGMMLPSGNDAAHQIAQIGGALASMHKNEGEINKNTVYNMSTFSEYCRSQSGHSVNTYLAQMNKLSKKISMKNSHFANPHGLSNPDNYSCAEDLCKLCEYAMMNQEFRAVVSTQFYQVDLNDPNPKQHDDRLKTQSSQNPQQQYPMQLKLALKWENTNRMLKQGWSGIKTGITPNAGPCLAASVERHLNGRDLEFLVVLIDSCSMEARWKEVREIVNWVVEQKIYF